MTYAQVAAVLSEATGRQVQFVDVPDAAARQGLADAGLPSWLVEQLVGAFRMIREGRFKDTTETVRALTGCPPRSFSQWAWEHASLF